MYEDLCGVMAEDDWTRRIIFQNLLCNKKKDVWHSFEGFLFFFGRFYIGIVNITLFREQMPEQNRSEDF